MNGSKMPGSENANSDLGGSMMAGAGEATQKQNK